MLLLTPNQNRKWCSGVNVTYIDDGGSRHSEDLSAAFEHAISTEVALKGLEALWTSTCSVPRWYDKIGGDGSAPVEESDEEMFACGVCDGLVKESDNECPHCGAIFEEDDDLWAPPTRGGPPAHQEVALLDLLEWRSSWS